MAEIVNANGASVKVRNPLAPTLLPIITLGIYSWVWYYRVNKELKEYGETIGDAELASSNPVNSVLAITLGSIIIVPALISFVGFVGRMQRAERHAGNEPIQWGLLGLLIVAAFFTGIAAFAIPYIEQQHLNGVWNRYPQVEPGVAPVGLPPA